MRRNKVMQESRKRHTSSSNDPQGYGKIKDKVIIAILHAWEYNFMLNVSNCIELHLHPYYTRKVQGSLALVEDIPPKIKQK